MPKAIFQFLSEIIPIFCNTRFLHRLSDYSKTARTISSPASLYIYLYIIFLPVKPKQPGFILFLLFHVHAISVSIPRITLGERWYSRRKFYWNICTDRWPFRKMFYVHAMPDRERKHKMSMTFWWFSSFFARSLAVNGNRGW